MRDPDVRARQSGTTWLPLIGAAGECLIFLVTLLLARHLSATDFQAFAVAAAAFALLSSAAPLGADQLLLKVVPTLDAVEDTDRLALFCAFALRRAIIGTLAAAALGAGWAVAIAEMDATTRLAVMIAMIGLPLPVAAHLGLEMRTARGAATPASAAIRLVLPGTTLAVLAGLAAIDALPGGAGVIALWGIGWVAALVILSPGLAAFRRAPLFRHPSAADRQSWTRMAFPLWTRRMAVGFSAQAGLLALGWIGTEPRDVAILAIAGTIAGFCLIPATMTHRIYARDLAPLVARRDGQGVRDVLRRRLLRIGPASTVAIGAALLVPNQIIGLFGYPGGASGATVLRLLAVSAGVFTCLGIMTTLLIYSGLGRRVTGFVAAGAVAQIMTLAVLVPRIGTEGAAVASLVATLVVVLPATVEARRMLRKWQTAPDSEPPLQDR